MGKINILTKEIAELISAGEVVERPASVIKELLENSIDAMSKNIKIEIQNGGKTLIRVEDNGTGISKEDVPKAFLRNATSKIISKDDLSKILTLGFRGEALASICAVSKVELITCQKGDTFGTRYEICGGEELFYDDYGCPTGTTMIIRDLFYNVPGRMKFLKKDVSEGNAIASIVDKVAISHPEISFKFSRDGKNTLNTPGDGDLYACIHSVYGKDFAESLIPVDYKFEDIKIHGFISAPLKARGTRSMQHFFINSRYVQTRTASAALEEGFKNSIMVGKFPACILFIDLPLEDVDVNVHPAKTEVRFVDERRIFTSIYNATRLAISKNKEIPAISFSKILDEETSVNNNFRSNNIFFIPKENNENNEVKEKKENYFSQPTIFVPSRTRITDNQKAVFLEDPAPPIKIEIEKTPTSIISKKIPQISFEENEPKIKIIGEAFKTYIIIEKDCDTLLIIDKHAAHERIIFEKLKNSKKEVFEQILLSPIIITLEKQEKDSLLDNLKLLKDAGFSIEEFGSSTIRILSAPMFLESQDIEDTICKIASYIKLKNKDILEDKLDFIYHSVACRSAIKAGKISDEKEIIDLINKLEDAGNIRYCPHGRPVSMIIKKRDLEKHFKRII